MSPGTTSHLDQQEVTPDIVVDKDEGAEFEKGYLPQQQSVRIRVPSLESGTLTGRLTATTVASQSTPPSSIHSVTMEDIDGTKNAVQPPTSDNGFGQPETTIVELVSTLATASAFPESFGLAISQKGQWIAAYTSTALHILSSQHLPQVHGRFFKVRRKPIAMAISDDPQTLAVLSNPHNVDVYCKSYDEGDQGDGNWHNLKQRSMIFGHEITTIALSPDGKILAAGYRGGVEIVACALEASENQRRQVSCEPMAELAFSYDGRTLLATSTTKKTRPSTIISVGSALDGPMSDEGIMESLPPERAWISQLLFPERASQARQAAMLPDNDGVVAELFAFNVEQETWGLYDVNMKRFTEKKLDVLNLAPRTHKMQYEATLPAVSTDSAQVALCTKHTGRSDVLIYRIPYSWRNGSTSPASMAETEDLLPTYDIALTKTEDASPESITSLRWVSLGQSDQQPKRLVALATSVAHPVDEDVDAVPPAASGRIVIVDTDKLRPSSSPEKVTINFDGLPQEALGDEHMDFEREVSLVRSRTQAVRRRSSVHSVGPRGIMARSSTSLGHRTGSNSLLSPSDISESSLTRRHSLSSIHSEDTESSLGALVLPMDEPYSQQQPRSNFSLQRAATISAQSRASRHHLLALPDRPLEFRRADGSRGQFEIPHESDADNWVPPPPPYSRDLDPAHSQSVPGAPPVVLPTLNTSVPSIDGPQTSPISIHSPMEQSGPLPARSAPSLMPQRRPVPAAANISQPAQRISRQGPSLMPAGPSQQQSVAPRQVSGTQRMSQTPHPPALMPGPNHPVQQEQLPQPEPSRSRPQSLVPFTTTHAPRTAQYRPPQTPPFSQQPPRTPTDSIANTVTPPREQTPPVETRHTFPLNNTSPPTFRASQHITAQDLTRPLPPLPHDNLPGVSSRLANVVNTGGVSTEYVHAHDPHGRERESKGKKKGLRCLVM